MLEVMNETTTIAMLYVMLTFSNWVPSPELRYQLGWVFIGVLVLNTIVHVYFLLRDLFSQWRLQCRRYRRKKRAEKTRQEVRRKSKKLV